MIIQKLTGCRVSKQQDEQTPVNFYWNILFHFQCNNYLVKVRAEKTHRR